MKTRPYINAAETVVVAELRIPPASRVPELRVIVAVPISAASPRVIETTGELVSDVRAVA
jgi:hypothetical protein